MTMCMIVVLKRLSIFVLNYIYTDILISVFLSFPLPICYSHIRAAETLIFTTSLRSPNPMFPTFASPIVTVLQLQWKTLSDFSGTGESVAFLGNKYIPI